MSDAAEWFLALSKCFRVAEEANLRCLLLRVVNDR